MSLVVVGNAAVDRTYRVVHLPVEGASIHAEPSGVDAGGKGLNQAVMAARAGAEVRLVTAVGDDDAGRRLRALLAAEEIDCRFLQTAAIATDESVAVVDHRGANCVLTTTNAIRSLCNATVHAALDTAAAGDWLLLQGNLGAAMTTATLTSARERGLKVAFNPSPTDPSHGALLDSVDVLVVNEVEASALPTPSQSMTVVTCGALGARLVLNGETILVPAPEVAAVDTVGAGDVFTGVLIAGLIKGLRPTAAVGWAVRAGALKVQRCGTLHGFPSRAELAAISP